MLDIKINHTFENEMQLKLNLKPCNVNITNNLLNIFVNSARDELPVFVDASVKERAVAFVRPLLDEAG